MFPTIIMSLKHGSFLCAVRYMHNNGQAGSPLPTLPWLRFHRSFPMKLASCSFGLMASGKLASCIIWPDEAGCLKNDRHLKGYRQPYVPNWIPSYCWMMMMMMMMMMMISIHPCSRRLAWSYGNMCDTQLPLCRKLATPDKSL